MPFFYQLPMPNLEITNNEKNPIILKRHLVKNDTWVEKNTPVAIVQCSDRTYEIVMAGSGILHKFFQDESTEIKCGDPIAEIHADGESIPYNQPYSKSRRVKGTA